MDPELREALTALEDEECFEETLDDFFGAFGEPIEEGDNDEYEVRDDEVVEESSEGGWSELQR